MDFNYPDSCIIQRSTGQTDNVGNELFSTIYSGECQLQYMGDGETSYNHIEYVSSPKIFVPVNNLLFMINDKVTVTTLNGRESEYTIKQYESISDEDIPELNDTCIWLKGGTDE